jgi:type IV pilus assembly protein PilA
MMKRKNNKKGFTLAELLIVVAIIAVLVAIAIPVFTSQLEKSRESTDLANVRSAYAELITAYLTDGGAQSSTVEAQQTQANWQSNNNEQYAYIGTDIQTSGVASGAAGSTAKSIAVPAATKGGKYTISISDTGVISVSAS